MIQLLPQAVGRPCKNYRVLLLIILLLFCGCPDPSINIDFREGTKSRKSYKSKFLEGRARISLSGFSGLSVYKYSLTLAIDAKHSKLKDRMAFNPHQIRVFLGQVELKKREHFIDTAQTKISRKSYKTFLRFFYDFTQPGSFPLDSVENRIMIILDDFASLDGKPVSIDTVFASEPKLGAASLR